MKRRGRPPKAIPPPQLARQEGQTGSSSAPHGHIPPPGQQAQPLPPPNTPAQPRIPPQAQQPPQVQHIPPPVQLSQPPVANVPNFSAQPEFTAAPNHPAQPGVAVAPNLPAQAVVSAPAASVAGVDPAIMAQMMQLQTTLLQTMLSREQAQITSPALYQEPRRGTIRDFNSFNPPVFTGYEKPEDADAWLRRIHNLLLASHIAETDMVEAARTKMDKMAGVWIESELIKRGNVMTWTDFKQLFIQKFIPPSSQRLMVKKFVALTQGDGDVSTYTCQFEILRIYASEILPTEESRIEWYINGLNSQLKPLVRACKPTTLLEAQQSALQMEQDAEENTDTKLAAQERLASHFTEGGPSNLVKSSRSPLQAQPAVSTASVTQNLMIPVTCHGCGRIGHKVADCWKKHHRCLRCGAADHLVAECPVPDDRGAQSVVVSQPATSAARRKASFTSAARSASGLGRGSVFSPAKVSVQRRAFLPTQSKKFRKTRGNQGRGK